MRHIDSGYWVVAAFVSAVLAVTAFCFFVQYAWLASDRGCAESCAIQQARYAEWSMWTAIALLLICVFCGVYGIYRKRKHRSSGA